MNTIERAARGIADPLLKDIAKDESASLAILLDRIKKGRVVVPKNRLRSLKRPCAIGEGLRTKVNANIGTSTDSFDIGRELKKLEAVERLGADTVMDLSTGPNVALARKKIIEASGIPVGTVPIYEVMVKGLRKYGDIARITAKDILGVLEAQAKDGVDFFTVHAGVTRDSVEILKNSSRIMKVVSRGGAILVEWMLANGKENPLYEKFDEVLDIAAAYDVTLSLGDGLRPGAIDDATDKAQIEELVTLGELQKRALKRGVQVIIEGPGHVPIDQIKANVDMEKSICNGAPFYVLGPLVTDIAPGYDHITSAIGGAIAASHGADFLCYVTPSEHVRLPSIDDVREGVIASRIAAHAADIAKRVPGAREKDRAISLARAGRKWKEQFALALDPEKPKSYRESSSPKKEDVCTMCSEYCSIKIAGGRLGDLKRKGRKSKL